jgi:hypothetical protein
LRAFHFSKNLNQASCSPIPSIKKRQTGADFSHLLIFLEGRIFWPPLLAASSVFRVLGMVIIILLYQRVRDAVAVWIRFARKIKKNIMEITYFPSAEYG